MNKIKNESGLNIKIQSASNGVTAPIRFPAPGSRFLDPDRISFAAIFIEPPGAFCFQTQINASLLKSVDSANVGYNSFENLLSHSILSIELVRNSTEFPVSV